jgi:2OG-Fe(II) oxygenase superfamily
MNGATAFRSESELGLETFQALVNHEIDAIRVPGFYPQDLCAGLSKKMLASDHYGRYVNAPLIGRIGQAYFESQASPEAASNYWRNAPRWIGEMRSACHPYLTPIDKLRLVLDELWPTGTTVASLKGKRMFVGLGRVFEAGGHAEPHQDVLAWDAPDAPEAHALTSQVAANTYLSLPDSGGELTLWRHELTQEEYNRLKSPSSYGIEPTKLPTPIVALKPEIGDLILFNSRQLHAVEKSFGRQRVTWSNFIGVQGPVRPLTVWS